MKRPFGRKMRWIALAVRDRPKTLAFVLIVGVLWAFVLEGDENVRADLNRALLSASESTAHYFRFYESQPGFKDEDALALSATELRTAANVWTFTNSGLSLQVVGSRDGVFFDSTDGRIRRYTHSPNPTEMSAVQRRLVFVKQLLSLDAPLYTHRQNASEHWTLQASIDGRHWLKAQAWQMWHAVIPSLAIVAFIFIPRYYRRVVTFRDFEAVLEQLPKIHALRTMPEEFILSLPDLATALHYDGAAIFLVRNGVLELKRYAGAHFRPGESLISCSDECFESKVFGSGTMLIANDPKGTRRANTSLQPRVTSGDAPCVGVPIVDPHTENAIGVLVAEKRRDFDNSNATELETLVRLVVIMFDQVRASQRLADIYSNTVRQTREITLGTTVGALSHNLNHRLSLVSMIASRLLGNKDDRADDDRLMRDLNVIDAEIRRGSDFLSSISTYRKLGSKADPRRGADSIDLVEVMTEILVFFDAVFRGEGIALDKRFEQGFMPRVAIDPLDLNLVISNLLVNVLEAFEDSRMNGPGRSVVVSIGRAQQPAQEVVISVADNGPGIAPEVFDHIFEDEITTKDYGTGAGLPYCRDVVEQTGGRIEADRNVQSGTKFNINLPIK